MTFWEVLLIGVGLSMDAVAVSISNGMVYPCMTKLKKIAQPLAFGVFQALMPTLGYLLGGLVADFLEKYSGYLIFAILGVIGGKMIYDCFKKEDEECASKFTCTILLTQAVATSIDAFAVGVGFRAVNISLAPSVLLIGATTFVLSLLAVALGKKFAKLLGSKAGIVGGVILIAIGVEALF